MAGNSEFDEVNSTSPPDDASFENTASNLLGTTQLDAAFSRLTEQADSLANSFQQASDNASGGSGRGGSWGASASSPNTFGPMSNPFSAAQQQAIQQLGGPAPTNMGGSGGTPTSPPRSFGSAGKGNGGNISVPTTASGSIAAMGSALSSYGKGQMPGQLAINTYQMLGTMGTNNMTNPQAFNALGYQAFGSGGNNQNSLAMNPQQAAQEFAILQSTSGSAIINQSQIGRAALGSTAAFSYTNPGMTAPQAAAQAQQMYSPGVSMQMRSLGYMTPRTWGRPGAQGGAALAQNILSNWGFQGGTSAKNLYANMAAGGIGQQNLQAMGLNPQTYAPQLEAYNRLFTGADGQRKLNAGQAQSLMSGVTGGSRAQQAADTSTLQKYGIATSDIHKLQGAEAPMTARANDTSQGFSAGLSSATTALGGFRTMLNNILDDTGMNNALGFGGGAAGTMGSLARGGAMGAGIGGALGLVKAIAGGKLSSKFFGGGAKGANGASAGDATAAEGAGGAAESGIAGGVATGGLAVGGSVASHWLETEVAKLGPLGKFLSGLGKTASGAGNPLQNIAGNVSNDILGFAKNVVGGGASGGGGTSNRATGAKAANGAGGISSQASSAVSAAESQLGVPYIFGDENPGVGFDCSGLMQWAYKQAGIDMPRTSEAQFAFWQGKHRLINPKDVQAGDLLYEAGADGSTSDPGHTGMAISHNRIVVADQTGTNVRERPYSTAEWTHAARPTGNTTGFSSGSGRGANNGATPGTTVTAGNSGMGMGIGDEAQEGSTEETDAASGAIMGGISAGSGYYGNHPLGQGPGKGNGGGGGNSSTAPGGSSAQNMAIGQKLAASRGWTGIQWDDLKMLWTQESGWNNKAMNPSSRAYGVAQALPSTKYPLKGRPPSEGGTSDAGVQETWGMDYISERYHNPAGAWAHEKAFNWYGSGGRGKKGQWGIVGDRGPELVRFGSDSDVFSAATTAKMTKSPDGPWSAGAGDSLNFSPLHPAFGGGTSPNSGGNGGVSLVFNQGAICIQMPAGTTTDTGANGRAMATAMVEEIAKMDIYSVISRGGK